MNKKYILLNVLIMIMLFFTINQNVYGTSYNLPIQYDNYSYTSEYDKYIGLYYTIGWQGGAPQPKFDGNSLYEGMFNLNVIVKKSQLDEWYSSTTINSTPSKGGIVLYDKYTKDELETIFQNSSSYKMNTTQEIFLKSASDLFLEKGTLTITDDSGNILAKLPHYVICHREDVTYGISYEKRFNIKTYHSSQSSKSEIDKDLQTILTTYNNFQTDTNIRDGAGSNQNNSNLDFWGDASSWFGSLKGSYQTPEQVNTIIKTFTDMINVAGTTIIVVATIVLGIKYIIGTVESQTSAKEGLINLFIACIFFFGWTSIKNLLFPGNNFIFTSDNDVTYTNIVGRLFSTFTYIAQFIVVISIIYVGIKYIFSGATGKSELKGKSVYFIIGIILVFATTNVLSFISELINQAL